MVLSVKTIHFYLYKKNKKASFRNFYLCSTENMKFIGYIDFVGRLSANILVCGLFSYIPIMFVCIVIDCIREDYEDSIVATTTSWVWLWTELALVSLIVLSGIIILIHCFIYTTIPQIIEFFKKAFHESEDRYKDVPETRQPTQQNMNIYKKRYFRPIEQCLLFAGKTFVPYHIGKKGGCFVASN